jgi:drug/metabolite transporter (DMT)-like permease
VHRPSLIPSLRSAGIPNLAGALVFAVIALKQYGPQHFFYLQLWWVMGVIVVYGLTLCLGAEVLRQFSQRHYTVGQLGLASSSSLVVTVLTAALLLSEPFHPATMASMMLILLGVSLRFLWPKRLALSYRQRRSRARSGCFEHGSHG